MRDPHSVAIVLSRLRDRKNPHADPDRGPSPSDSAGSTQDEDFDGDLALHSAAADAVHAIHSHDHKGFAAAMKAFMAAHGAAVEDD